MKCLHKICYHQTLTELGHQPLNVLSHSRALVGEPMRGLELIMWPQGQWGPGKKLHPMAHNLGRTWRLYAWIGQYSEKHKEAAKKAKLLEDDKLVSIRKLPDFSHFFTFFSSLFFFSCLKKNFFPLTFTLFSYIYFIFFFSGYYFFLHFFNFSFLTFFLIFFH